LSIKNLNLSLYIYDTNFLKKLIRLIYLKTLRLGIDYNNF